MKKALKKNAKYIFNILFIALIGFLTFRLMFKDQELSTLVEDIRMAKKGWVLLGAVFVFLFVAGESCIIKYMLLMFKKKIPFFRCLKYSFIGFFFSCITPSSSGGQPAQMYYMKKDGISLGYSTLILLIITVAYKAVLVIMGLVMIICRFSYVRTNMGGLNWLLILGFVLNVGFISLLIVIFFKPQWARNVGIKLVNFLTKIKIMKEEKKEKNILKINKICETYMTGADYIKHNIHSVIKIFLITVVQRTFLFAVTWVIYKAYGLSGTSFFDVLTLQVMIGVACEMMPLPGAAGITEGCFIVLFGSVFGELVKPAILLSRGLSFYFLLIMSAVVTFVAHFIVMKKQGHDERSIEEQILYQDSPEVNSEQKIKYEGNK